MSALSFSLSLIYHLLGHEKYPNMVKKRDVAKAQQRHDEAAKKLPPSTHAPFMMPCRMISSWHAAWFALLQFLIMNIGLPCR